jgi:hypothetical protein
VIPASWLSAFNVATAVTGFFGGFPVALSPTAMDVGLALRVEFSLQLLVSLARLLRHPGPP